MSRFRNISRRGLSNEMQNDENLREFRINQPNTQSYGKIVDILSRTTPSTIKPIATTTYPPWIPTWVTEATTKKFEEFDDSTSSEKEEQKAVEYAAY